MSHYLLHAGEPALAVVAEKVKVGLKGIEQQADTAEKYSSLDKSAATYGVVKKLRDNDAELHENNPVTLLF